MKEADIQNSNIGSKDLIRDQVIFKFIQIFNKNVIARLSINSFVNKFELEDQSFASNEIFIILLKSLPQIRMIKTVLPQLVTAIGLLLIKNQTRILGIFQTFVSCSVVLDNKQKIVLAKTAVHLCWVID